MMLLNPYRFAASGGGLTPPAIGAFWNEQGGYYAGSITYADARQFYLIVSDVAGETTGVWGNSGTVTGAVNTDDGAANQATIEARGGAVPAPFATCRDYSAGGFDDWYLLAKDELAVVRTNLYPAKPGQHANFATGGPQAFKVDRYYWTSTESESLYAWARAFYSDGVAAGSALNRLKTSSQGVRPVRRVAVT